MRGRASDLALAACLIAFPAWVVLAGLAFGSFLEVPAAVGGSVAALAIAALVAWRYRTDLSALADQAGDLALDEEEADSPPWSPRTPLTRDLALALARAQRRIAAAQQEMEARATGAEAVVDGVPEPLLVLDRRRQIVHANLAAETLLGADIVGRDLATVLRHPAILACVGETLLTGNSRAVDVDLAMPVERSMRTRIAPLPQWSESGDALILTLEDQTSIRRSEQMRVDFVANVSHELRTPLATLLGFIETLQGPARDDPDARDRFLGIMQDQATRMRRLVDDLLSLSRIELEEHNAPTRPVDLSELLQSVAESLELVAAERQMRIAVDCPPDLPLVPGDDDQLAQVFTNLLENAIKYARPETTVEVTARIRRGAEGDLRARGHRSVAVVVRDHGDGIQRKHIARLTERFYRVDTARSRNLGGTGLGLAIVKHIVNRHRGTLEIDSTPGEGSRFTVSLPIVDGDLKEAGAASAPVQPGRSR